MACRERPRGATLHPRSGPVAERKQYQVPSKNKENGQGPIIKERGRQTLKRIEMQGDSICITEFQFRWLYNMSECSGFNQQYLFSLRICSFNRTQQRAVSCTCHQLEQLKITLMSMPTVGPVEHLCRAPSCNLNFLSTRWLCSKHPERKWKHSAFQALTTEVTQSGFGCILLIKTSPGSREGNMN